MMQKLLEMTAQIASQTCPKRASDSNNKEPAPRTERKYKMELRKAQQAEQDALKRLREVEKQAQDLKRYKDGVQKELRNIAPERLPGLPPALFSEFRYLPPEEDGQEDGQEGGQQGGQEGGQEGGHAGGQEGGA